MNAAAKPQNAAVWFEIPAANFERAVGFYERVFDTRLKREKFGPADMAVFPVAEKGVAGAVVAGEGYKPAPEGMGYFAQFIDSEGNRVGLHSMG